MSVENLYPTPVYLSEVDNFEEIQNQISLSLTKAKFGAIERWGKPHKISDPTFTQNFLIDNNVTFLLDEINKHIKKYLIEINAPQSPNLRGGVSYEIKSSWVTKFDRGDYAHIHSHGHHDIAGVYYYKVSDDHGNFFFECPTPQMTSSFLYQHLTNISQIKPVNGLLMLFPGYLNHGVYSNQTDIDRMSVSFNVGFNR